MAAASALQTLIVDGVAAGKFKVVSAGVTSDMLPGLSTVDGSFDLHNGPYGPHTFASFKVHHSYKILSVTIKCQLE